jgi:hypothetical protein
MEISIKELIPTLFMVKTQRISVIFMPMNPRTQTDPMATRVAANFLEPITLEPEIPQKTIHAKEPRSISDDVSSSRANQL